MGAVYQCCPGDEAQGSSTFTFHAGPATYAEARADCQARGVDIASIHSAEENADAFALTNRRDTWIGINDMQTEGTWVWSDGSTVGYTNWAPGEPNSYEGDEDCAIFWSGGEYWKWYDAYGGQNCNARLAYLCRDTRPRPPPPPQASCPDGWTPQAGSNKCNKIVGRGTQEACESTCSAAVSGAPSGLACIENQVEMDCLADLANPQSGCCNWIANDFSCCTWVGLYQHPTADQGGAGSAHAGWSWRSPSCTSSFRPWNEGEPNQYGGTEEDCAMLGAWGSRQLNDIQCYNSYQCLCETEGVAGFRVVVNLVASESIEAFMGEGGEARKAAVLNALIDLSGLTRSTVLEAGAHITVTPASVSIRAELPVADGNELAQFDSLSSGLASTGAASSALVSTSRPSPHCGHGAARYAGPRCDLNTEVVAGQSAAQECLYRHDHRDRRRLSSRRRVRLFALLRHERRPGRPHRAWDNALGREMTNSGPACRHLPVGSPV